MLSRTTGEHWLAKPLYDQPGKGNGHPRTMPGFTLLRSALPIRRRTSFSRLFGDIFAYETNEIAQMKRIDGRDPFLQLVAEETVRPVLRRPEQIRLHYSPNSNKTNLLIEIASNPLAAAKVIT